MKRRTLIVLSVFAVIAIVGLQVFATWTLSERARGIVDDIAALEVARLSDEKTRSEIAKNRIGSELDRFFWQGLITSLLPLATLGVALVGAGVGLREYLDAREKEQHSRDKERLDRAAGDLTQVLDHLADGDARKRTIGLVGCSISSVRTRRNTI